MNGYLLLGDIEYMEQDMSNAQRAWEQAAKLVPENQAVQQRLSCKSPAKQILKLR